MESDRTEEDAPDRDFEIWPENAKAVRVFVAMETQWNYVANGVGALATGFRYCSLPVVFEMLGVKRRAQPKVLEALVVMEAAAVAVINERQTGKT